MEQYPTRWSGLVEFDNLFSSLFYSHVNMTCCMLKTLYCDYIESGWYQKADSNVEHKTFWIITTLEWNNNIASSKGIFVWLWFGGALIFKNGDVWELYKISIIKLNHNLKTRRKILYFLLKAIPIPILTVESRHNITYHGKTSILQQIYTQ
jgi:hypothetical protein